MENLVGVHTAGTTTERRAERAVNTFVVRRWQVAGTEARYEIAHIQSGRRTVAAGDAVAAAWIVGFGPDAICPADHPVVARAR
jgi:hypothetical protein